MAIEVFEIKWTKRFPVTKALQQPEAVERGIYAYYIGDKLHLFGKTKEDFRQRFSTRNQYAKNYMDETQIKKGYACFGLISVFAKSRMGNGCTPKQLKDIESYFINRFDTKGNDESTRKGYKGDSIIVINSGIIPKEFDKVMSPYPELLKVLKRNIKFKTSDSDDEF